MRVRYMQGGGEGCDLEPVASTPSGLCLADYFLKRDTPTPVGDLHTPVAESSSGPPLLTISGGLGELLR